MKALIDMDLVVYRVGSACDNWHYVYMGERFDSHKELKAHLNRMHHGLQDRIDQGLADATRERDPESWEDTRLSVVSFIDDLIEPFDEYEGFISGKGNFRYKVATILPYKGTRSTDTRPYHYDAIRQFLVEHYKAKFSENMEADDCLGLAQTDETCIVSVDKDLDMIPGVHWNWEKDKRYYVDELDGMKNFYCQMLTGDKTDNILGLYGVGQSSKLLKNIRLMEHEEDMITYIYEQYRARFGNYAERFIVENSELLWILQSQRTNPFSERRYWE